MTMNRVFTMEQTMDPSSGREVLITPDMWAAIYVLTQGVELLRTEQGGNGYQQVFVLDDVEAAASKAWFEYEHGEPIVNIHKTRRALVAIRKAMDGDLREAQKMHAALALTGRSRQP